MRGGMGRRDRGDRQGGGQSSGERLQVGECASWAGWRGGGPSGEGTPELWRAPGMGWGGSGVELALPRMEGSERGPPGGRSCPPPGPRPPSLHSTLTGHPRTDPVLLAHPRRLMASRPRGEQRAAGLGLSLQGRWRQQRESEPSPHIPAQLRRPADRVSLVLPEGSRPAGSLTLDLPARTGKESPCCGLQSQQLEENNTGLSGTHGCLRTRPMLAGALPSCLCGARWGRPIPEPSDSHRNVSLAPAHRHGLLSWQARMQAGSVPVTPHTQALPRAGLRGPPAPEACWRPARQRG